MQGIMQGIKKLLVIILAMIMVLSQMPLNSMAIDEMPSGITNAARVSYEIISGGKTELNDSDTQATQIRFILKNATADTVSFQYKVINGSIEGNYLSGTLAGTVNLTKENPEQDVTVEITPFADNPKDMNLPNNPNAFWTGDQFFYLSCSEIKHALFTDGANGRESLIVPVPVASTLDIQTVYNQAIDPQWINQVSESGQLSLTAEISAKR